MNRLDRIALVPACLAALLTIALVAPSHARSWRIGVGGGRVTGYIGTLALNGIHRECLTERQLTDPAELSHYDLVIISSGTDNPPAVAQAIEKYVAGGGRAITEERVMPSPAVVPGTRLGPAPGPNLLFAGYDHPISAPLKGAGVVPAQALLATAIIPDQGAKVTVLAEFTDQGVNDKYVGKLTGGRKKVPAMLLLEHGKGRWLFCGSAVSFMLALRGPELQPWVLASIEHLTDGEIVPRLENLSPESYLLPRVQWTPEPELPSPHTPPGSAKPAELPEGFEAMETPPDANVDFVLTGELMTREEAQVLLSYHNPDWLRTIRFERDRVRVIAVNSGRERVIHEVPRPTLSESLAPVVIRRQPDLVTVSLDGEPLLMAVMDSVAGTVAVNGIIDAYCQSVAPVFFDDDFMRAEGEDSPWETPEGKWELHKVEGEPAQGANPFAFRAVAESFAAAVAGYSFWDDYDLGCSVRSSADAVGLYANYQAPDDCLVLRLTYPRPEEAAYVSLSRLTPAGTATLAGTHADVARESWHRLRLRVSGGRAVVDLDGREVLGATDDLIRGQGQIGIFAELGSALFDDVTVRPWDAVPQPIGGDGPWAWEIEGGGSSSAQNALVLNAKGSVRALAPIGDQVDAAISTELRMNKVRSAGVLLRYRGPRHHYRVALERTGRRPALQIVRVDEGDETLLAETPVNGDLKGWVRLQGRVLGRSIEGRINGQTVVSAADHAFGMGRMGLYCAGRGSASFRATQGQPIDRPVMAADPPTPPFAGIIDQHTWAGRGSGWVPTPADPETFWHRGFYPGPVEVRLGVHRRPDGQASALAIIGDGADTAAGYVLAATQAAGNEPVGLSLMRAGEKVAYSQVPAPAAEGYALSLEREGDLFIARLDDQVALTYRDADPLPGAVRVGFRRDATKIDPADVEVVSPHVRNHIFKTAPAEWQHLSGTWEISNRWSCSPQWTWLAGWNQTGQARTLTREAYVGDLQVDYFIAAKMMPKPDGQRGHYEELRDLHAGLCEDGEGGGYHIVIGADAGARSYIERDGKVVVTNTAWSVPQTERHNNWLLVTLIKRGATISVCIWDNEVLRYEDPDPLQGGRIALGTQNNGVIVPRVTIYGQPTAL